MDEAFFHSSVHSIVASLQRSLIKGSMCWADFSRKRDNEVIILFRDYIDFFELGVGNLEKALHFSVLASISHCVK